MGSTQGAAKLANQRAQPRVGNKQLLVSAGRCWLHEASELNHCLKRNLRLRNCSAISMRPCRERMFEKIRAGVLWLSQRTCLDKRVLPPDPQWGDWSALHSHTREEQFLTSNVPKSSLVGDRIQNAIRLFIFGDVNLKLNTTFILQMRVVWHNPYS